MATSTGPIPQFLSKVANNWGLSFVYPKIWAVRFIPHLYASGTSTTLITNISKVLRSWDNDFNKLAAFSDVSDNIYKNLLSIDPTVHIKTGKIQHFILATKLSTPGESVYIGSGSIPGQQNGGGAIWGHVAGGRENGPSRTIDITFLDTNKEFNEYITRPWIIAVAHQGLIESSNSDMPSLKCDIIADFFAKSSPAGRTSPAGIETSTTWYSPAKTTKKYSHASFNEDAPFLRKTVRFFSCVPIKLPEKNFNFSPDIGNDEAMTTVTFSYDYYTVSSDIITSSLSFSANEPIVTSPEGAKYQENGVEVDDSYKSPIDGSFDMTGDQTGYSYYTTGLV